MTLVRSLPLVHSSCFCSSRSATSVTQVFLAGHKLRVDISSSNFPRFDRNLNTGENAGRSSDMRKAENVVYHDAQHASALILPVVP